MRNWQIKQIDGLMDWCDIVEIPSTLCMTEVKKRVFGVLYYFVQYWTIGLLQYLALCNLHQDTCFSACMVTKTLLLVLAVRRDGKFPPILRTILQWMAFLNSIFLLLAMQWDQTKWMAEMLLSLEPCEIIALKFLKLIFYCVQWSWVFILLLHIIF